MIDIHIKNGILLPLDGQRDVLKDFSIIVDDGKIAEIGPTAELENHYAADKVKVIDATGMAVLPGLINTHTHLAMTLFRGVVDDISGTEWLERAWSIESNLTPEDVLWGSLLGCVEMIKTGTTCFADHYFLMEQVAEAVKRTGIRGALAQAVLEFSGPEKIDTSLETSVAFANAYDGYAEGRVKGFLGPHSAYTCSLETLQKIRETADETGLRIHLHLAEGDFETEIVMAKYGKSTVTLLHEIGFLGEDILGAHVVTVDDAEIEILKRSGVKANHNPVCKLKGGTGISPVPQMLEAGINVSLGTDGTGSNNNLDLFEEMKTAAIIHKLNRRDPATLSAWQVLEMATINGAKALGMEDKIGSIEVGKQADLIVVDLSKPHLRPTHNLPSLLVYSASGADVDTVIVGGRVIMEARTVQTVDEDQVCAEFERQFSALMERSGWRAELSKIPERIG
ncbi:MAG: amidohydrolase family protein [Candidatus Bipolaricaulia bacterium]